MKLSIITPVFNAVRTLEKTILGVLTQANSIELEGIEVEYIVVDGGSTDGSLEVIHRYLDQIDVLISEPDQGVYDAMNKGILRATGDIVGIINADDWYTEGALETVANTFRQHPATEILYSPIDNYLNDVYLNTFTPGELKNLPFKFTINHPSCFVKRTVYDKIGLFDLHYSIAADYDFILRAYLADVNFHYTDFSLACYSLNGMSGRPLSKFKQIRESWQVGCKNLGLTPDRSNERRKFYILWLSKEFVLLPIKLMVDLRSIKQIKNFIRSRLGGMASDQYGAW